MIIPRPSSRIIRRHQTPTTPILQLHVPTSHHRVTSHGIITPESSLALAHDDIERDSRDERGDGCDGEREERLVDAAHGYTG